MSCLVAERNPQVDLMTSLNVENVRKLMLLLQQTQTAAVAIKSEPGTTTTGLSHLTTSGQEVLRPKPRYMPTCPNANRNSPPLTSRKSPPLTTRHSPPLTTRHSPTHKSADSTLHKTHRRPEHLTFKKAKSRLDKGSPSNAMITDWLSESSPECAPTEDKLAMHVQTPATAAAVAPGDSLPPPPPQFPTPPPEQTPSKPSLKEKFLMIQVFKRDKLLARDLILLHEHDMTEVNISFRPRSTPQTPHTTNYIPFTLPSDTRAAPSLEFRKYFKNGLSIFCKRGKHVYLSKSTTMKTMCGMQSLPTWTELKHELKPVQIFNFEKFNKTKRDDFNSNTFCNSNTVRLCVGWAPHPTDIYKTEFHIKLSFSQDEC